MKWLLILFATYMLVLPCIPCNAAEVCCLKEEACAAGSDCSSDEKDCTDEEACSDEHSCSDKGSDSKEHSCAHEGSCSDKNSSPEETPDEHEHSATCPCCPSFSCNTCHSIIVSGLVLEEPLISARSFDNTSFADKPLVNFSAIIWQPPKVLYFPIHT